MPKCCQQYDSVQEEAVYLFLDPATSMSAYEDVSNLPKRLIMTLANRIPQILPSTIALQPM